MPRSRIYSPGQNEQLKLSRAQVSLFKECPRCFYMKQRHGIGRPGSPPYLLNSAVDGLLKNEFEIYRESQTPHPLFEENKLNFIPYKYDLFGQQEKWRSIKYQDEKRNMVLSGIIDDLWLDKDTNKLVLADYKATSTKKEINIFLFFKWQMDFYHWLLKKTDRNISTDTYFVYANADRYRDRFDATLHFNMSLKRYAVDDSWVEPTLDNIRTVLDDDKIPEPYSECKNCNYAQQVASADGVPGMHQSVMGAQAASLGAFGGSRQDTQEAKRQKDMQKKKKLQ